MHIRSLDFSISRTVICLVALATITAILCIPFVMRAGASKGLVVKTKSHAPDLPNYDIRSDKGSIEKLAVFRSRLGKDTVAIASFRNAFTLGEKTLRESVPTLKIEYNSDLRVPEVIGTDVKQGRAFLTSRSSAKRSDILVGFLKQNAELTGVASTQVDGLKVFADYKNPDGNLSFVELDQEINGIPVFAGEIKAGFTKKGEMIRVINNLAPALDYNSLSTNFGDPAQAVNAAASYINGEASKLNLKVNSAASTDIKLVFGTGDSATTAEKMYFPTEPGVAVPAWRVLIWQPVNAYYVIVDAESQALLWRKNITEDQTQSSTYSVYVNPNAMINVARNPFPLSPRPTSPNGVQGASIGRTSIARIGNEAPYTFNNLGWITDGGTITDGNAVQAGLDRDGVEGVDTNGEAASPTRNFVFAYNPYDPNTNAGDAPVPATQTYPGSNFQQGAVTQLFYICNWYHDITYTLGFNEQARNFQNNNFGRGGVAGDRVMAEGQDSSGTNNANFSTPADGGRGRMQMYIWTSPTPNIDGDLDADVVVHEHTHGLSNRLHGNGSGLSINMSRAMGEGWSDFYAISLLSQPSDPVNGVYPVGSYDTYLLSGVGTNNNYYGIRRFPYAVKAFTGGPNNLPHDPLTFADIDASQMNLSDGAFAPAFSGTADEVHNAGEVWCTALWEVRGRLVNRLGWAVGNRKALQIVTDGMKLAPLAPTYISERDAILAAAQANPSAPDAAADVSDVWSGFALRGIGYSASIQNVGTGVGDTRVTEAYDLPNLYQTPSLTISDPAGNNNGYPEPGEPIQLTIPLTNSTGNTATGVTLQIVGGGSANYGTISNGTTVSKTVNLTIPIGTVCGSTFSITINVNSSLGPTSFTRSFALGVPITTFAENFDNVTAPGIPAGWTVTSTYAPMTWVSTSSSSDSPPNSMFAADLPNCSPAGSPGCSATDGGGTDLTSPLIPITAQAATLTFRNNYNTEPEWDGGVLEISVGGGAFQDIVAAGGTFLQNGYNASMGVSTPNPLGGRNGWTGNSGGYLTTVVLLPVSAINKTVQFKWRFGADNNTAPIGGGWNIDSIQVVGNYSCSFVAISKARADFDGDGKTDLSVFRPSDGNWYLNRSTAGFSAVRWGTSGDVLVPGDYDGDGKTDIAVYRPSTGIWYVIRSSDSVMTYTLWGNSTDIPVPGDYDGDGKTDIAVYRPSNGGWYIVRSKDSGITYMQWGVSTDKPVPGDYDGDGKTDIAVWRPSDGVWYIVRSSDGVATYTLWGVSNDIPVQADYDGDGKTDIAVWRPSTGIWHIIRSSDSVTTYTLWGVDKDIPIPGDYDGDGKTDIAVWRPSTGIWYIIRSSDRVMTFSLWGVNTDKPIPAAYHP